MRDTEDRRLVQTGVVGDPGSDDPVAMPTDAADARLFRAEYNGTTFWCGELLGGCGGQLTTKIYDDRVCHFAHLASSDGHCGRTHRGQESADHLYISRALKSLPGGLLKDATPTFDFDPTLAGTACTGLTFTHRDEGGASLIVRLADFDSREVWAQADEERQRVAPGTQWLFAEHSRSVWWTIAQVGHGFRVKCEQRGGQRTVMIETVVEDGVPRWSDAEECRITDSGLWTPHLEEIRRARTDIHRAPAAPSGTSVSGDVSPQPSGRPSHKLLTQPEVDQEWSRIKTELLVAREAGDRARVRSLVGEGRRLDHAWGGRRKLYITYELAEYETWLTATTPLPASSQDLRNGGPPAASPIPIGVRNLVGALVRAATAKDHQLVVTLDNRLRELLDRLPDQMAAEVRRILSKHQDLIGRSHAIVERAQKRSQQDHTRTQRTREAALDRAADVVRDLLNRVARDQSTVTWGQLRLRAVELADLKRIDEPEVLRRVDAKRVPGTPRPSSLVVEDAETSRRTRRYRTGR